MTPAEALECFKYGKEGREAVKVAIKALETVSKYQWVSVKGRLPEEGEPVFVIVSGRYKNIVFDNAMQLAEYYDSDGWILTDFSEWIGAHPDYWMPLPPLPEEVEE